MSGTIPFLLFQMRFLVSDNLCVCVYSVSVCKCVFVTYLLYVLTKLLNLTPTNRS